MAEKKQKEQNESQESRIAKREQFKERKIKLAGEADSRVTRVRSDEVIALLDIAGQLDIVITRLRKGMLLRYSADEVTLRLEECKEKIVALSEYTAGLFEFVGFEYHLPRILKNGIDK